MNKPIFETFWEVNGERYFNINEVAELVEAGHIAVEVPAQKQSQDYELRLLQERWHQQAIERYNKIVAEQQHRNSPEGKRQMAVRHAQENPGGIVSGGSHPAFDELDAYGVGQTNVFK